MAGGRQLVNDKVAPGAMNTFHAGLDVVGKPLHGAEKWNIHDWRNESDQS